MFHLLHANQVAIVVVARLAHRNIEVESVVDQVRLGLANVITDPGRAKAWTGEAVAHRVLGRDHAQPAQAVHENAVSGKKTVNFREDLPDLFERGARRRFEALR